MSLHTPELFFFFFFLLLTVTVTGGSSDDSQQKYKHFLDTVTVVFIRMGICTEDSDEWLPRGRSIPHIRSDIPLKV